MFKVTLQKCYNLSCKLNINQANHFLFLQRCRNISETKAATSLTSQTSITNVAECCKCERRVCKIIDLGHFSFLGHYRNIYAIKRKMLHDIYYKRNVTKT